MLCLSAFLRGGRVCSRYFKPEICFSAILTAPSGVGELSGVTLEGSRTAGKVCGTRRSRKTREAHTLQQLFLIWNTFLHKGHTFNTVNKWLHLNPEDSRILHPQLHRTPMARFTGMQYSLPNTWFAFSKRWHWSPS